MGVGGVGGAYQTGHDARIVDSASVIGVSDDDTAFFSRQIYGVNNEALMAVAGELCEQTGFKPEDAKAAGEAKGDALPQTVESTVDISARN